MDEEAREEARQRAQMYFAAEDFAAADGRWEDAADYGAEGIRITREAGLRLVIRPWTAAETELMGDPEEFD